MNSIPKEILSTSIFIKYKKYWSNIINSFQEKTKIIMSNKINTNIGHEFKNFDYCFNNKIFLRLKEITSNSKISVYVILVAAINAIIKRYYSYTNITIVSPVYIERKTKNTFNKNIPILTSFNNEISFKELIIITKDSISASYENQDYPISSLYDNDFKDFSLKNISDLLCMIKEIHNDINTEDLDFPINFIFNIDNNGLSLRVKYNEFYIDVDYLHLFVKNYEGFLIQALNNLDNSIKEFDFITSSEKDTLLLKYNHSNIELLQYQSIIEMFQKQVVKNSERIAFIYGGKEYTYSDLNSESDNLANYILNNGVKPNSIIALMVEPSEYLVIGIIAILKCNCTFLPLDPKLPFKRINYMLEDSNSSLLLAHSKFAKSLQTKRKVSFINQYKLSDCSNNKLINKAGKYEDTVYLIYTSGTTGKPKGVLINNKNLINYISWFSDKIKANEYSHSLFTASYSFDAPYTQFFTSLLNGATIHILNRDTYLTPNLLLNYIEEHAIYYLKLTPSLLAALIKDDQLLKKICEKISIIIVGGEPMNKHDIEKILKINNKIKILNHYGPTETTIGSGSIWIDLEYINEFRDNIIGYPIYNTRFFILDENKKVLPTGAIGELYISGLGLSIGYLNQPDLTDTKFEKNVQINEKLYKTGDIGRWNNLGQIELIGRADNQIKHRGFRIELDEVRNCFLKIKGINNAVVTYKCIDNNVNEIIGYITTETLITIQKVKTELLKVLPDYMIPSHIIQISEIPLTVHNKIDYNSLPLPRKDNKIEHAENKIEKKLVSIWSDALKIPENRIGVNTNFFEIGGHSLTATITIAQISRAFNISIPISEIFNKPTIRELGLSIEKHRTNKNSIKKYKFKLTEKKEYYNLTSSQQRIYFIQKLYLDSLAYNSPYTYYLKGEISKNKIQESIYKVVQKHEILRTIFIENNGIPYQKVLNEAIIDIVFKEVSAEKLESIVKSFIKPFDLSYGPLFRIGLFKVSEKLHLLVFDIHHIIFDGFSNDIFIKDFLLFYNDKDVKNNLINYQYKDVSEWQKCIHYKEIIQNQKSFWLNKFKDTTPIINLPIDSPRPTINSYNGTSFNFTLSKKISQSLFLLSKQLDISLFTLLINLFYIFLSKITNQNDIIIGTPITGRQQAEFKDIIGIFINTLALRFNYDNNIFFHDLIQKSKDDIIKCFDNQDYPFERLVQDLKIEKDTSRNPIFDVLFIYQHLDNIYLEESNLEIEPFEFDHGISKFDLSLKAFFDNVSLTFSIEYNNQIFKNTKIEKFAVWFQELIYFVLKSKDFQISNIDIISKAEKELMLNRFNETSFEYNSNLTIDQLIYSNQVEKNPDSVALVFENMHITYAFLNKESEKLASNIRSLNVQPNEIIGIYLDRSVELIIAILAVLKSGCTFVPLDPKNPSYRINFIIKESNPSLIITKKKYKKYINNNSIFCIDSDIKNINSDITHKEKSKYAYILFTSGSTGKPKGTIIEHKNILNFIKGITNNISFKWNHSILCNTSFSFDIFILETLLPLTTGTKIILTNDLEQNDPILIGEKINKLQIDILQFTPSVIRVMIENMQMAKSLKNVSYILIGGEKFPDDILTKLKTYSKAKIFNMYGPTETTVWSSLKKIDNENINIGKPISNTKMYILNHLNNTQPLGIIGELAIGGDGVAIGYLNSVELTHDKFINNQYVKGKRIYKTGDYAKWLDNGEIEFIGRVDDQLKIRGHRIEPTEIKRNIMSFNDIVDAVVIPVNIKNDIRLAAYYKSTIDINVNDLKNYLYKIIPDYMVPTYYYRIDEIPVNNSGKIDKKQLPNCVINQFEEEFIVPTTFYEKKLADIWSKILSIDEKKISLNSNFFELGGHSLSAISLESNIQKEFNINFSLISVFNNPYLKQMSLIVQNTTESNNLYNLKNVEKKEYYSLSKPQSRMYLIQVLNPESVKYNICQAFEIQGDVSINDIKKALNILIEKHESLRTSFKIIKNKPVQFIFNTIKPEITYYENLNIDINEVISDFIKPFQLYTAPLFRILIIKQDIGKFILAFDIHHIIADGLSLQILGKDMQDLLLGKTLPNNRLQYKDYTNWQNKFQTSKEYIKQKIFWLKVINNNLKIQELPYDNNSGTVQNNEIAKCLIINIEELYSFKIKNIISVNNVTPFIFFLSVFNILISRICKTNEILVGTTIAGRRNTDLNKIVGMFVNLLVLKCKISENKQFSEYLYEVKDNFLTALSNQDFQYDDLIDISNKLDNIKNKEIVKVLFSFDNLQEKDFYNSKNKSININPKQLLQINEYAKYDLSFHGNIKGNQFEFKIHYNSNLFLTDSIEKIADEFKSIANFVSESPDMLLSNIPKQKRKNINISNLIENSKDFAF